MLHLSFGSPARAESYSGASTSPERCQARRLVIPVVERYRLNLKDLAREPGKCPDGMTKALARAARRRTDGDGFRRRLDDLDRSLAELAGDDR